MVGLIHLFCYIEKVMRFCASRVISFARFLTVFKFCSILHVLSSVIILAIKKKQQQIFR